MAFTLTITGASGGTLDLNDMTPVSGAHLYSIMVQDWQPRVAKRRIGQIGGVPYEDVAESLALAIVGHTRAAVLDGLNDLAMALDEARLWWLGDPTVGPILLNWLPEGSSLVAAVSAAVMGPAGGDDLLSLPVGFNQDLQAYWVELDLGLMRRGMWLGAEESATTSSADTQPEVVTLSGYTDVPAVQAIRLSTYPDTAGSIPSNSDLVGYFICSPVADSITITEAESMTASGFSSHADAGARGGNVMRLGFGAGGYIGVLQVDYPNLRVGKYAVFAIVRNLSLSIDCTVEAKIRRDSPAQGAYESLGTQVVASGGNGQQVLNLGTWNLPYSDGDVTGRLWVEAVFAAPPLVSTDIIEIDTVCVVYLEGAHVVGFPLAEIAGGGTYALEVDHRLLESPMASVHYDLVNPVGDMQLQIPYHGVPTFLVDGTDTYFSFYGIEEGAWLPDINVHSSGRRRPYYLIPK